MRQSRARISVELRLGLQTASETRIKQQEGLSLLRRWEMPAPTALGRALGESCCPACPPRGLGGGCSPRFCCSQESSSSTRADHPCYPKDYNETILLSSFRTSPCTNQSDPRLTLSDRNVTLEGRGNASGCLAAVKKLFNFSACGQSQDCTFDGVYQPPASGQFIVRQIPYSHLCGRACPRVLWCPCVPHGTVTSPQQNGGKELPNYHCPRAHQGLLLSGFPASSPNGTMLIKQVLSQKPSFQQKKTGLASSLQARLCP